MVISDRAAPTARVAAAPLIALVPVFALLMAAYGYLWANGMNETVSLWLGHIAERPAAMLWVIGAYVVAGFLLIPLTALILATLLTFGTGFGVLYAMGGTLASALVTYGVGRALGAGVLERMFGARFVRARERLTNCSVGSVVLIRLLPVAPFSVVNALAGAMGVALAAYLFGTAIGVLPGIAGLALVQLGLTSATWVAAVSYTMSGLVLLAALGWWVRRRWHTAAGQPDASADHTNVP
ncbi:MAG: TVP38/TMEM64 family protein [Candidatus Binatia bacterium]